MFSISKYKETRHGATDYYRITLGIFGVGMQRQKDHMFLANLSYMVNSRLVKAT